MAHQVISETLNIKKFIYFREKYYFLTNSDWVVHQFIAVPQLENLDGNLFMQNGDFLINSYSLWARFLEELIKGMLILTIHFQFAEQMNVWMD
jgi:hypothetical protein